MRPLARLAVALSLGAITVCSHRPASEPVTLATTTSVGNSGLLEALLPAFRSDTGLEVRAHLVGSGRALAMLAVGQADVVLSHAPDAENAALAQHPGWSYRKLMFNDFVIVGPKNDPAAVAAASDVADAFRRIARSQAVFISRGDGSGTHERETQLWKRAGGAPKQPRLVVAGQGMGTTLRIADQMNAYTLSDRATFAQNASTLSARIVFEGGPQLLNTYAAVHDNDPHGREFADWLARGRGRDLIAAYRIGNAPAFTVWPSDRPHGRPDDQPK